MGIRIAYKECKGDFDKVVYVGSVGEALKFFFKNRKYFEMKAYEGKILKVHWRDNDLVDVDCDDRDANSKETLPVYPFDFVDFMNKLCSAHPSQKEDIFDFIKSYNSGKDTSKPKLTVI